MKALSIKQPWAWAVMNLPKEYRKDIENRTWNTKHRGEFLVHASKGFDDAGYERMRWYLKELGYKGHIPTKKEFAYGVLLGTVELVDVTQKATSRWWEGVYGFKLKNAKPFLYPIAHKGALNFFNVDDAIIKEQMDLVNSIAFEYTPKGHKYIKVTRTQMVGVLHGLSICDNCCKAMDHGYLIPVLNSCYCKDCFEQWKNNTMFYEEDIDYENLKTKYFLKAFEKESLGV
jgi:hypothetical protein